MAKCLKCNVNITDNTLICPLCQHILEPVPGETLKNAYPNIEQQRKKMIVALRIYAFAAIVAELLLVIINLRFFNGIFWSVITGIALLYTYLTIWFSFHKNADYRIKLLFQACSGTIFLIAVDFVYGFHGWSVYISLPVIILALDALTFILMMVNRKNYESFLWLMLVLIALSVIPIIFYELGFIHSLTITFTALGVSVIEFLGTFIVGGQKARMELERRFHV
ncbi:MAG: hypothetical protein HFG80_00745 [Eubacterium sp.]|nr:hypothetical protein [Eubacterium sp.]